MGTVCPHCCSDSGIRFLQSVTYTAKSYSSDLSNHAADEYRANAFAGQCRKCGNLVVFDDRGECLDDVDFLHAERVYPAARCTHGAIPETVRNEYSKAERVMWVDANAFGILIRRAIEAICTAEGIKGRNLEIRLVELQKQKSLPHNIAVVAKRLRILGNRAAHDSGGLHPLHVHLIDDFFCVLVDYLYVLPSRLSYAEQYDLRTATR